MAANGLMAIKANPAMRTYLISVLERASDGVPA